MISNVHPSIQLQFCSIFAYFKINLCKEMNYGERIHDLENDLSYTQNYPSLNFQHYDLREKKSISHCL